MNRLRKRKFRAAPCKTTIVLPKITDKTARSGPLISKQKTLCTFLAKRQKIVLIEHTVRDANIIACMSLGNNVGLFLRENNYHWGSPGYMCFLLSSRPPSPSIPFIPSLLPSITGLYKNIVELLLTSSRRPGYFNPALSQVILFSHLLLKHPPVQRRCREMATVTSLQRPLSYFWPRVVGCRDVRLYPFSYVQGSCSLVALFYFYQWSSGVKI